MKLTDDKIVTDLYYKFEDSNQYLHYDSCHAEHITQQTFALVKTYWRVLEDILKTSSVWHFFVFQEVFKTWLEDVFLETSWRRLPNTSLRRLENLLKNPCKDILKTSWRRLEDVFGRRIAITFLSSFWLSSVKFNGKRCQACLNIHKTDIFEFFQTKQKYKINHHLNCNDKCLTY